MKRLLSLLIFSMVLPIHAGIVICGTRVTYPAEDEEVMVQLVNQGNRSSLLQMWTDDDNASLPPEKIQIPFMLMLPVAKIGVNSGQQVETKIMPDKLPTNRESIFYLDVLDIPSSNPEQEGENAPKFVMQNRVKLFYRPASIAPVNKATFRKLLISRSGNGLVIKNDSANWVTVSDAKTNNVKVSYETIIIAPLESRSVNIKSNNVDNWHLTIISGHGNYISDEI